MDKERQEKLALLLREEHRRLKYRKLDKYFPDDGEFSRDKYPKHIQFMAAGKDFRFRGFVAANRIGKSVAAGCEMTYHLTGKYPHWWEGYRFTKPIKAWAIGFTNQQTKEVLQELMLGSYSDLGSGLIPKELLKTTITNAGIQGVDKVNRPGIAEAVDTVKVASFNEEGIQRGWSTLSFKAAEQGRDVFQGHGIDLIWMDEDSGDAGVLTECLTRLMTTHGLMMCTFTPLKGLSNIALQFLPNGQFPDDCIIRDEQTKKPTQRWTIRADWDDVPHLTEEDKEQLLQEYTPEEREARSKGYPVMGEGRIYPFLEEDISCTPFKIPEDWKQVYAIDPGHRITAIVWAAIDPNTGVTYVYDCYYGARKEIAIVADTIKRHGTWIPGVIDPAADQGRIGDGKSALMLYEEQGIELVTANNAVEAGIYKVYNMLSGGQLKIFNHLSDWFKEYRIYRRESKEGGKSKIIKQHDHAMDATRYLVMTGLDVALNINEIEVESKFDVNTYKASQIQKGASDTTGY